MEILSFFEKYVYEYMKNNKNDAEYNYLENRYASFFIND